MKIQRIYVTKFNPMPHLNCKGTTWYLSRAEDGSVQWMDNDQIEYAVEFDSPKSAQAEAEQLKTADQTGQYAVEVWTSQSFAV